MWSYICLLRSIQVIMEESCSSKVAKLSEHCRHKQFNASFEIDGVKKDLSLFSMIRNTHHENPRYVVSAYSDNAAVLDAPEGQSGTFFSPRQNREWTQTNESVYYVIKAETHNHPTAISPFPGAATGVRHFQASSLSLRPPIQLFLLIFPPVNENADFEIC